MRAVALVFALMLPVAAPAAAPQPTPAPQKTPAPPSLDNLFAQLRAAETPQDAKPIEAQILASFRHSGSPSVDLLMGRAEAALVAGNKDVARRLYEAVTDVAPRYAEGWHRRGLMQSDGGDDSQAMLSLQKTVQLNPRHFEAMAQLGEMLEEYGDKAGALKLYRRALSLNPHFEGLQRHIDGLSRDVEGQGI